MPSRKFRMAAETQTTITTTRTTPEEPKATLFSSMLAIVGLIILVVIVIWGLVHLASLSKPWFSSLFARPAASIALSLPASVTSRIPFTLSWEYSPTASGSYAFLYQCESGFQFETPDQAGVSNQIPCGVSFMLPPSAASLPLTPVFSGKSAITIPVSIVFVPSATSSPSVQGNAAIIVEPVPSTITTTPSTPAPATPAATKPRATGLPAQAGPADLSVRIVSVSADQSGNGTAVFDIENVGSGPSGTYAFTAELPTSAHGQSYSGQMQSYTYNSPVQSSLGVGDHITNTLRFTQAQNGGVMSVTVDPSSAVRDLNRTNNYAYQTLTTPYNYNYNQPQSYYNQQPQSYYTY